eukprot:CAMPEP_0171338654 /NCGR_PEP_ID=MMETSP0878-20121228/7456_1 /TAXON_ID=67004 /ORGANISM="Thalassiosira weissflogii, Strain CCMP1336" /LENGTH=243 /DNA_ID=CAMNT_0011840455 /DNA_START=30 /DNA_END=761 /DNA_ORIENTATION=-
MAMSLFASSTLATILSLALLQSSFAFLSPNSVNTRFSLPFLTAHPNDHAIHDDMNPIKTSSTKHVQINSNNKSSNDENSITTKIATVAMAASLVLGSSAAWAVSGGGLDYANLDITGQDFSGGNYKGKDFTQVIAKGTTFANSNIQGCRFYKAYLVNANFESTDARGASFEDTSMENANLRNINAAGSYFGQSLIDVKTMENGDFTEAQIPVKTLKLVCEREDVKGTNPVTGVDTRESLMCLD